MEPEQILFFKIDDYLRGRLSPADKVAFEAEMAADATLAALVYRQKQENQALEVLAERDLRTRMNAWERQAPAALAPAGGRYRLGWMKWAAAALVVLAAGWWIIDRTTTKMEAPVAVQPVPQETPGKNAPKTTPLPTRPQRRLETPSPRDRVADVPKPSVTPGKTAPLPPAKKTIDYAALSNEFYRERDFFPPGQSTGTGAAGYDRAVQDFKKGKYSDLLPQLRKGGKLASNDLKTKELLAHSLLKSGQYDAAVTAFREIVNTRNQPYADRAEWALALVYLRQMPARSAELNRALERIAARPGHAFYGKARALQGRLAG
jgi:tetratricopeptide (TPR) repeat protein